MSVKYKDETKFYSEYVKVSGTGKVDYGKYKPRSETRSGRQTQQPQWLVQSRTDENDGIRIKRMKPEKRLKLLNKTLKKSSALTERLLKRLDREWDDIDADTSSDEGTFLSIRITLSQNTTFFVNFQNPSGHHLFLLLETQT